MRDELAVDYPASMMGSVVARADIERALRHLSRFFLIS
jgi:hypothetical protein